MSLFSWFSKPNPSDVNIAPQSAGLRYSGGSEPAGIPKINGSTLPQDRRFNLGFTLAGIGTFSNFFGNMGGRSY